MKGWLDIPVGRAFSLDGSTKLVFRRVSRDHYVFEAPDRFPMTFTETELIDLRDTNRLKDWVPTPPGHPSGVLPTPVAVTYAMAKPGEQKDAEWRLDYCMAWAEEEGISLTERGLGPVIDRVYCRRKALSDAEPPPPNYKTVQTWVRHWLGRGKSVDALVSQERFKGNRRPRLGLFRGPDGTGHRRALPLDQTAYRKGDPQANLRRRSLSLSLPFSARQKGR